MCLLVHLPFALPHFLSDTCGVPFPPWEATMASVYDSCSSHLAQSGTASSWSPVLDARPGQALMCVALALLPCWVAWYGLRDV